VARAGKRTYPEAEDGEVADGQVQHVGGRLPVVICKTLRADQRRRRDFQKRLKR